MVTVATAMTTTHQRRSPILATTGVSGRPRRAPYAGAADREREDTESAGGRAGTQNRAGEHDHDQQGNPIGRPVKHHAGDRAGRRSGSEQLPGARHQVRQHDAEGFPFMIRRWTQGGHGQSKESAAVMSRPTAATDRMTAVTVEVASNFAVIDTVTAAPIAAWLSPPPARPRSPGSASWSTVLGRTPPTR